MNKNLITQIKLYKANINPIEFNNLIKCLYRLNGNACVNSSAFLNDIDKIKKIIQFRKLSNNATIRYYHACYILLASYKKPNKELIKQYKYEYNKLSHYNSISRPIILREHKINDLISSTELYQYNTKLKSIIDDLNIVNKDNITMIDWKQLIRFIVLHCICKSPIIGNQMLSVRYDTSNDNINYIKYNGNNYVIVFNTLINKKYDGATIIELDEYMNRYIDCILKHTYNSQYLITSDRNKTFTTDRMTHFIRATYKKEFNKNISVRIIQYILK